MAIIAMHMRCRLVKAVYVSAGEEDREVSLSSDGRGSTGGSAFSTSRPRSSVDEVAVVAIVAMVLEVMVEEVDENNSSDRDDGVLRNSFGGLPSPCDGPRGMVYSNLFVKLDTTNYRGAL